MNHTIEGVLRFVNLTASGLLAGSLGFGEAALVPGWHHELPRHEAEPIDELKRTYYFNAIGPVALGSAVTLAIASRGTNPVRRILDAATAVGLAGVLAATVMVTVPINKELESEAPRDYPSDRVNLVKNWSRAHAVRTTLGIGAFVCAVASNLSGGNRNRHTQRAK
jgi:anthrone oxygenase-like protein